MSLECDNIDNDLIDEFMQWNSFLFEFECYYYYRHHLFQWK